MNLRKALDRAQKERQGNIVGYEPGMLFEEISSAKGQKREEPWQAPVYNESSRVFFDQETLVENKGICITEDAPEIDSYKVLRAQIMQKGRDKGLKTLMVTSVQPGEGKTTTAINLAINLSNEFNQTVLLVDCDLEKQDIHRRFGYESDLGIGDYLLNDTSLDEVIRWPGVEKLTIISGGQTIHGGTESLGSPKMKGLVAEMKERYADRYVIFDLPSLLDGADALTFAPYVDSILLVVQAGRNSVKELNKALDLFPREKLLGFVLNRHE